MSRCSTTPLPRTIAMIPASGSSAHNTRRASRGARSSPPSLAGPGSSVADGDDGDGDSIMTRASMSSARYAGVDSRGCIAACGARYRSAAARERPECCCRVFPDGKALADLRYRIAPDLAVDVPHPRRHVSCTLTLKRVHFACQPHRRTVGRDR